MQGNRLIYCYACFHGTGSDPKDLGQLSQRVSLHHRRFRAPDQLDCSSRQRFRACEIAGTGDNRSPDRSPQCL